MHKCVFLDEDFKCTLHDLKLKPKEGRLATCKNTHLASINLREEVKNTWNSERGRSIIKRYGGDSESNINILNLINNA